MRRGRHRACRSLAAVRWLAALRRRRWCRLPARCGSRRSRTRPWSRVVRAVSDGIVSLRDRDFSVSVAAPSDDELGELVAALQLARRPAAPRTPRSVSSASCCSTPSSRRRRWRLVLTNARGRVVYSNLAARQLLYRRPQARRARLRRAARQHAPAPLREARRAATATRCSRMEIAGEAEVYHLSQRRFLLNAQPHRLLLLKQLTRELAAQEVAVWKKVIRVIAHELNNSLAPISSLAHSGQLLAQRTRSGAARARVHDHRRPRGAPRHRSSTATRVREAAAAAPGGSATGQSFIARLQDTMAFQRGRAPCRRRAAHFDASQMEQVMINLLKNAAESGSAPEDISVQACDERRRRARSSRSRTAAPASPRKCCAMRCCRSIRPRRPARALGSRCVARSSKRTAAA